MIKISIDPQLKKAVPNVALGVVFAPVVVTKDYASLWKEINKCADKIFSTIKPDKLYEEVEIRALREAYRAIGKDPSRYRGSAEALVRRILQGKGLYKVNTVVDINNLISLETFRSVGSYNIANLKPPVVFRIGKHGEFYKGISKDVINVAELPVFADETGAFGSPTSDSERAMITMDTKEVMMVIISFSGTQRLLNELTRTASLLSTYTKSPKERIETLVVE